MSATQRATLPEVLAKRAARGRIKPAEVQARLRANMAAALVNEQRAADRKAKAKAGRIEA